MLFSQISVLVVLAVIVPFHSTGSTVSIDGVAVPCSLNIGHVKLICKVQKYPFQTSVVFEDVCKQEKNLCASLAKKEKKKCKNDIFLVKQL